ncbi:hypothetical protein FOXYS1_1606 [Fusarium oxysporum]|uniref:Uncharacterized protein n=1 Tax=Fusarium oxysporum TaxID=5507 RepID=A0A8H5ALU3_FUSOX|nr:hypothetical protein FOXYS1_1606 [Fusarium oxysporum]
MDPNLELYRSLLHLIPSQRRHRMAHLPRSEVIRVETIVQDEDNAKKLKETIAGRDLIQVALDNPSEIKEDGQLKNIVLGRTNRLEDENKMVRRITDNVASSSSSLIYYIENFDQFSYALNLDAWKLVYCDIYYVDRGNATLQEIYEACLQEEELQTLAARARELVRDNDLKRARRNAKWMIPAIEGLSEDEKMGWADKDPDLMDRLYEQLRLVVESFNQERGIGEVERRKMMEIQEEIQELNLKPRDYRDILEGVWKRVSPAPPPWLQHILQTGEQFGFIYYRSRELYQTRYNWNSVWSRIINTSSPLRVTWSSIHCQGSKNWMSLHSLETENWPIFSPNEELAEDDDLRKHFKKYCEENCSKTAEDKKKNKKKRKRKNIEDNENLLSPGILRNTFIVIPLEFVSGNLNIEERDTYDPCWVWAYDADWDGSDEVTVDGEKYEGRVKVAKWSLNSWFYAARWEGILARYNGSKSCKATYVT